MAQIIYREDMVGNFRLLGFATGAYMCTCRHCGVGFIGDKRAYQCLDCAIKMVEEKFTSTNQQSTPLCDCEQLFIGCALDGKNCKTRGDYKCTA
jgi:hypothetical protein